MTNGRRVLFFILIFTKLMTSVHPTDLSHLPDEFINNLAQTCIKMTVGMPEHRQTMLRSRADSYKGDKEVFKRVLEKYLISAITSCVIKLKDLTSHKTKQLYDSLTTETYESQLSTHFTWDDSILDKEISTKTPLELRVEKLSTASTRRAHQEKQDKDAASKAEASKIEAENLVTKNPKEPSESQKPEHADYKPTGPTDDERLMMIVRALRGKIYWAPPDWIDVSVWAGKNVAPW
jgi:hypothetical protein